MERLGSCARTRNLARNARRFALVPRGKQGGESVMQARCKPVAWAELRRSYSVAFVFTSYSLRILLVFCTVSPVGAPLSPRWLRCGCAFCLPASTGFSFYICQPEQAAIECRLGEDRAYHSTSGCRNSPCVRCP